MIWFISINSPMTWFIVSGEWTKSTGDYQYLYLEWLKILIIKVCASIHKQYIDPSTRLVKNKQLTPPNKLAPLNQSFLSKRAHSQIVTSLSLAAASCWQQLLREHSVVEFWANCTWISAIRHRVPTVNLTVVISIEFLWKKVLFSTLSLCMCVINYYDHVIITVNIVHI